MSTLNDGLGIINKAVLLDSSNIEIRLLNFYILNNVPAIVGYSEEAEKELNTIYDLANNINSPLHSWVSERVVKVLLEGEKIDSLEAFRLRERFSLTE